MTPPHLGLSPHFHALKFHEDDLTLSSGQSVSSSGSTGRLPGLFSLSFIHWHSKWSFVEFNKYSRKHLYCAKCGQDVSASAEEVAEEVSVLLETELRQASCAP